MRRVSYFAGLLVVIGLVASLSTLYITRDSRPVITCFAMDHGIRPKSRCILNPFRDRNRENKAEEILLQLRAGDPSVLGPLFANLNPDNRNHLLENETKLRVRTWRIGEWSGEGAEPSLMYWVTRENYEWEEEVRFYFKRKNGDWEVTGYTAIY